MRVCMHVYTHMHTHTNALNQYIYIFIWTHRTYFPTVTPINTKQLSSSLFYLLFYHQGEACSCQKSAKPRREKVMGARQIKMPTAGEEAEGLWGRCCQLRVFDRTGRRGDHTQTRPITGTLTKTERENSSSNKTRPPLIIMLLTKTVLWGRSFFYFPVWGLLLWDSYKILWPANLVQNGKCPYSSLSHHFFSLS